MLLVVGLLATWLVLLTAVVVSQGVRLRGRQRIHPAHRHRRTSRPGWAVESSFPTPRPERSIGTQARAPASSVVLVVAEGDGSSDQAVQELVRVAAVAVAASLTVDFYVLSPDPSDPRVSWPLRLLARRDLYHELLPGIIPCLMVTDRRGLPIFVRAVRDVTKLGDDVREGIATRDRCAVAGRGGG